MKIKIPSPRILLIIGSKWPDKIGISFGPSIGILRRFSDIISDPIPKFSDANGPNIQLIAPPSTPPLYVLLCSCPYAYLRFRLPDDEYSLTIIYW